MGVVLFFSKLNLVSNQIHDVYEGKYEMNEILSIVHAYISTNEVYTKEIKFIAPDGNEIINEINYSINILERDDEKIYGYLYKQSLLFYNDLDEETKTIERKKVKNTESINFMLYTMKERLGFHTTQRFGYKEFNESFAAIINQCMEKNGFVYRFDIDLINSGISLDNIKEELNKLKPLRRLEFKFKSPNPDSDDIRRIHENGEKFLDSMKESNTSSMSVIFESKNENGINTSSDMIEENVNKIVSLEQVVDKDSLFNKGYIGIEATDKDGKYYTTADAKPYKYDLDYMCRFREVMIEIMKTIL